MHVARKPGRSRPTSGPAPARRRRRDVDRVTEFEQLYAEYAQATYVFFLRKVGNASRAADLNQDLYLRLSRSQENFEGRCSWRTWIFAIARVVLAEDRTRRYRRLADRTVSLDADALMNEMKVPADADEQAQRVLLRERLVRCVRRLSDQARAVVIAHYFEGVTLRELSAQLQLANPSGARAVLIGAQRKLRRCLEGWRHP